MQRPRPRVVRHSFPTPPTALHRSLAKLFPSPFPLTCHDAAKTMPSAPGSFRRAWFRWKSLRLPWRKQWLCGTFLLSLCRLTQGATPSPSRPPNSSIGFDLAGNTFWEFKDQLNSNRFRRIVKYSRHIHLSDVKISRRQPCHYNNAVFTNISVLAQWHQWLRHTRETAPTVVEQERDLARQRQMKLLAAAADERWASKPSVLDMPSQRHDLPSPAPTTNSTGSHVNSTQQERKDSNTSRPARDGNVVSKGKESPWKAPLGNPGDDWQPAAWKPDSPRNRG